MSQQSRSIFRLVLSPERMKLRHPRQREEQHNLNTPPDHMPLGGESGAVERQVVDPHVEVGQRHGHHQKAEQHGGPFSGARDHKADAKEHLEAATQQVPKGWSAKVCRHNCFEWLGVGPVEQPDAAEGQPEHNGKAMETYGSKPTWDHVAILFDLGWNCG